MITKSLSSQLLLASLTSAAIFFDPTAVKHSCVNETDGTTLVPGVPLHLIDINTTYDEQTILLKPITPSANINNDGENGITRMCILHRWTLLLDDKQAKKGFYYPLGRSHPYVPGEVYPHENDNAMDQAGEYGDWNRPAGRAGRQGGLEYICGEAANSGNNFTFTKGEYLCEVTLPMTSKPNAKNPANMDLVDAPYFLTYYERTMTVRNEISRFLQKNSFGPTESEIDILEAAFIALLAGDATNGTGSPNGNDGVPIGEGNSTTSSSSTTNSANPGDDDDLVDGGNSTNATTPATANNTITNATATSRRHLQDNATVSTADTTGLTHADAMAKVQRDWILQQMDPSTFSTGQFSSLRAYWRRRLNPRKEETYRIGESGPHPCEKNSRWRKFAFTHYDVQNAKMLRWGNQDLGGSYQTQTGHRITVERVEYEGPVDVAASTGSPTEKPTMGSPTSAPAAGISSPTGAPFVSSMPSISSAPTAQSILLFGDMEGDEKAVLNQWPGRCPRTVIKAPGPVAEGEQSLRFDGGKSCLLFRPISPACSGGRVRDPIRAGDTLFISLQVRAVVPNRIFEIYTRHYHESKQSRWSIPDDDSYMVSRTLIENKDEWVTIKAVHVVGDDWTYNGEVLEPTGCNHFHLRFRIAGGTTFYLDDVKMTKVSAPVSHNAANGTNTTLDVATARTAEIVVPKSGFFANPNFELGMQYWRYHVTMGHIRHNPDIDANVMVMRRGKILRQTVLRNVIPMERYQFGFWTSITGVESIDFRAIMRLRFVNNDLENGPCHKRVCNFLGRVMAKNVRANGGNWQQVISEEFDFFGNYPEWEQYGYVDFILFQLLARNLDAAGEYSVTNFEVFGDERTNAPSSSMLPSFSPTNLIEQHISYIVRYAGEIRTIIKAPFQIDKTGEVLPVGSNKEYQLCLVDEVEGRKAEFPNRMNFFIGGRCQPIRHGNPTVDIDPNVLNLSSLHILDLSDTSTTSIVPINVDQTFEGDWLLETAVQYETCASFPSPYDNDYRGADPANPDAIPSRFTPDKPVFAKFPDGSYALFDSRLLLHGNTIENPIADGGGTTVLRSTLRHQRDGLKTMKYPWADQDYDAYYVFNDHNVALCSNEQPNFLNRDSCKLSYGDNVCVKEYIDSSNTLVDVQLVVTFDDDTLARFFNATDVAGNQARYLYAVDGLRWDESINANITRSPCSADNPVSRWKPRPDIIASDCTNILSQKSNTVLAHALETSNDENPYLRDIYLWNDFPEDGCDEEDIDEVGMLVMTEEGCWENMHPDYMSIYDFTSYENKHAKTDTTGVSFISNWTTTGVIHFPENHPMSYFEEEKSKYNRFDAVERYSYASTSRVNQGARYGDHILLDQFADQMRLNTNPDTLKSLAENIAVMTLSNKVTENRGGGTLVCGSPNEVAPDPTLDDYFDVIHRDLACIGCQDSYGPYAKQKATVWAMNVLEGEDQLCQRMAWSLYELLNVGAASNPDNTESNLYTYDILIRHCFGSYFDILKEMTFSPKMGEQFNFAGSTATRLSWDTSGVLVFPDENYAREIMQLYTIGLHELHRDGTEIRDYFGRVIQTYTNVDILSNARIFTGFAFTARRGNVEELFRSEKSRQDPLRIEVDKHDFFPKSSVDGNWIGDSYPLCVDLPRRHFLKLGAKYQFRGSSSLPRAHYNPRHWDSDESIKRFVLSSSSDLYQKLCNPGEDGTCNYSNTVALDSNLACYGKECRVDDLEVVQVAPGAFYEYIRQPCVSLSFYDSPKKIITGFAPWILGIGRRHTHAMCADPRTAVAARSCCNEGSTGKAKYNYDFEYHGERVVYKTNLAQCYADNGTVCDPFAMKADNPLVNIRPVYNYPFPSQNTFFWTDSNCTQTVKVRRDGMIAIIHEPVSNSWFTENTVPFVDLVNTVNFFSVTWEKDPMTFVEIYPSLNNTCGSGACSITNDDACLCTVSLSETPVFDSLPSREDVLSLKIGAFDPETFSDADVTYSLLESLDDVEAFVSSESGAIGATTTIFKVLDEYGDAVFLKNMMSSIKLGDVYEIRNPPSFMNLAKIELRDAEYEVDAFLAHLLRYPSNAPFISKKLIQYHGISNPSPGFVQRVTQAFISGSYTTSGVVFGDFKYGNMKAVAAAISLDPESLSPVIDEDPASGNIREPLLKVIQFMRSLSFQRRPNVKFRHGLFDQMSFKIGQMVFDPPDQFSFFSCDYSPPGVFSETDMVSPESELMSMSSVVGLTNGLFSLVNFGLANADGGFAPLFNRLPPVGDYSTSMGYLTYPFQTDNANDVASNIDEISTMMTAGRLSPENKQVLLDAHGHFREHFGVESADRVLLKLMTATPEFHTSNTLRKTGTKRTITPPAAKSSSPYKAIVYINLSGGVDSFNILTPGASGCSLYDEYQEMRGKGAGIGLKRDEILPIEGYSARISGCSTLGVNKHLSVYKDLFDEGKGIFFANMGHLHKPVTKENWLTETRTDLFSHHTMKHESHVVDAFREGEGPGVLGRMLDILEAKGHAVGATAVNSKPQIIDGSPTTGRLADIMSTTGVLKMFDRSYLKGETEQQLRAFLESLHAETDDNSGFFANAWSQSFVDIWNKTDALVQTLRNTDLETDFKTPRQTNVGEIAGQLKLVARLISTRNERGNGINYDVFYCEMGGYDSHFKVATVLKNKLPSLNYAVATFWAEMKAQGLENSVTVVQGSEFGRTITPNSNEGSDHAWGGNYFMFGGDVKGGKILGEYPKSFRESDPTNIGRGRLIPTTSWDALFYGLTQWMGITEQDEIDYVLPNSQNFGCKLFTDYDLFNTGQQHLNGCGGPTHTTPITFQVPDIRMLTGEEQKQVCKIALKTTSNQFSFDQSKARCYVADQNIVHSEISPGMYDISGIAVLNFDKLLPASTVITAEAVKAVSKAASATASDFVILGAIPQSEAPSEMPSMQPSTSHKPSSSPSMTAMPSDPPSEYPSIVPSQSAQPSDEPSISTVPSILPTAVPSVSQSPTPVPTTNTPSISVVPTPALTERRVFEEQFRSKDIGYVGTAGQSFETLPGLYTVQGSGLDIWSDNDNFHYMYVETSGDATFTALIEGFDSSPAWFKAGVMVRDNLSQHSSHYSMFMVQRVNTEPHSNGVANEYRTCEQCASYSHGIDGTYSSVWLRVVKEGNVLRSYYKSGSGHSFYWTPYGAVRSMTSISSNGYYIGIAVCSRTNTAAASLQISNIQLTRTCSSGTITQSQCDQASNCESGQVSGTCYKKGEVPAWESTHAVSSIFDVGSTVTSFGCDDRFPNHAIDRTTSKMYCDRTNLLGEPTGLVIKPSHIRPSKAEGLRVYAHNNCPNCDPVSYIFEGRNNITSDDGDWFQISQGDLPWKSATHFPRNGVQGLDISSSYHNGDNSFAFTEVSFYNHDYRTCGLPPIQMEYRGTISSTTNGHTCQFWSTQSPHFHGMTVAEYPNSGLEGTPFKKVDGCIAHHNLEFFRDQNLTPEQCAKKCMDYGAECVGVKYFPVKVLILHSNGINEAYAASDCILSGTTAVGGCDNLIYKMEFYLRLGDGSAGDIIANHNYCRNPGNSPGGAWCHTSDPSVRWEYCNVPDCEGDPDELDEYLEYKITWTATRDPDYLALQIGEIEVPGLLDEEYTMPNLDYAGNYVASVIQGSTDITTIGGYSTSTNAETHSLYGDTHKFHMTRGSLDEVPGLRITPAHQRMSIVTGVRVYTANNNPKADPIKYRIRGRTMGGALVKDRSDDKCWYVNSSNRITPQPCDSSSARQRFYMNDLDEIRVKSHPGLCLDPHEGMDSSHPANVFKMCYSDSHGISHAYAQYHKFSFDPSTEQFESVYYPGTCIDYNLNSTLVYVHECHTGSNQKFYFRGGNIDGMAEDGWTLISKGSLPWISEFDRNPTGVHIASTYENGDDSKYYMGVNFYDSTTPYYEYEVTFPEQRDPDSLQLQLAEIELPGMLLNEGEYLLQYDIISLPATTTISSIHGMCVKGAVSAYASSSYFGLTYTAVEPFAGLVKGWDDRDTFFIEGMEGTPCADSIYLKPSLYKEFPAGTSIAVDLEWSLEWNGGAPPTICMLVENAVSNNNGGFPESLVTSEYGFTNFGTFPGFGFTNGGDVREFMVLCNVIDALIVQRIRIQHLGIGALHLREVQVIDSNGNNRALNKEATQSSTSSGQDATLAVDGSETQTQSNTQWEQDAWWEIDLGEDVVVKEVIIFNSNTDNQEDRLSNAVISLFHSSGGAIGIYEIGDATGISKLSIPAGDFGDYTLAPSPPPTSSPTIGPTTANPTKVPTQLPTKRPTDPPTKKPTYNTACSDTDIDITVKILTDNYPSETAWRLDNLCTGQSRSVSVWEIYQLSNTHYTNTYCVNPGRWRFTITDSYGDGICCGYGHGSFKIFADGQQVAWGGHFSHSAVHEWGGSCN